MIEVAARFGFSLLDLYNMPRSELRYWQDAHYAIAKAEKGGKDGG